MLNIYLNSYHWAKLTFLKDFFKSKISVSRSLFGNSQLTQILLNFKTFWWNLKIRGLPANIRLGEDVLKTCWRWLQSNIFLPSKTSCKHVLQTSWRRLEKWKIEKLFILKTPSRRLQDILEYKKCFLGWEQKWVRFFYCFNIEDNDVLKSSWYHFWTKK